MLQIAFIVIIAIIIFVLILALLKPAASMIVREILINASPEAIFPLINSSKRSYEWMPWADGDPNLKVDYTGPESGVGSSSSWTGKKMGVGTSEVIESVNLKSVKTKLSYTKPHVMNQIAEVSLHPETGGTLVRWSVNGHNSFMFRVICIFINIDKIVGDQFLVGLNRLKSLAEKPS